MPARQTKSAPYDVGYGKPPRHTQFREGRSGNPGGRPRRPPSANELLLGEAYRQVAVKIAGRKVMMPALQAAMRSQLQLAAGGNVHAQRAVFAAVQAAQLEEEARARESADRAREAEEAAAEAVRNMQRKVYAQARREVRAQMEKRVSARAVRDVEAALRAAGETGLAASKKPEETGPAAGKRPEEMTYAEAAARVSFLLGLGKRSSQSEAGPSAEQTAPEKDSAERESATRDAAAKNPAARKPAKGESARRSAAPLPQRQTAPAARPVPPAAQPVPPAPLADPPAAPTSRWRDPPLRDRYARHPGREALSMAPSTDARFNAVGIPC